MKFYHQVIFNVEQNGEKQRVFRAITLSFPHCIACYLGVFSKIFIFIPADNVIGVEINQISPDDM